jgi:hypothetical protein
MQAVRKIVDAETLAGLFSLPRSFTNRRLEITILPIEETAPVSAQKPVKAAMSPLPRLTSRQIDEIVEKSAVKHLLGVLKGTGLPEDITMQDIREMRLKERGGMPWWTAMMSLIRGIGFHTPLLAAL